MGREVGQIMKDLMDQLSGLNFIFIPGAVCDLEGCKLGVVSQICVRNVRGEVGDFAPGCREASSDFLNKPVLLLCSQKPRV